MLTHPAVLWLINTDLFAVSGHRYRTEMRPRNKIVPLAESQHHVIDPTNAGGTLHDCIEHWLHVGRRAADDAEHLSGCGLMLQGLAQFSVSFLQFFEQTNILNRNDCLIGKRFEQLNLSLGERTNLCAANIDRSDGNTLAK